MTNSEQFFLILCEELSFHRAAERCFVSQQALSDHIRRLEEKHGVTLFQRRPKVAMTLAGEALYRTLIREAMLEKDLERDLSFIRDGSMGKIHLGVGITRARIYLPKVTEAFWKENPGVELVVQLDDTANMMQQLKAGQLDLFIGTEAVPDENIESEILRRESIYLLVPDALLPQGLDCTKEEHEIGEFQDIPFIRNSPKSILNVKVDEVLRKENIKLRQIADVGDYQIQLDFCIRGWGAAFFPDSILSAYGYDVLTDNHLTVFHIRGLENQMEVDLAWDTHRIYPTCVKRLLNCIREIDWQ